MQQHTKPKYDKHELLKAYIYASTQPLTKEMVFDEIWETLLTRANRNECFVEYKLPIQCSSFLDSPVDEQVDKLYFFVKTELEKIGNFSCSSKQDALSLTVYIRWDSRIL